VVAPNWLGTLNHTLLAVGTLQHAGVTTVKVVLMSSQRTDSSSDSNGLILSELLDPTRVFPIPFLGRNPTRLGTLKIAEKKIKENACADSGLRYCPPLFFVRSRPMAAKK
jgi:dethiobiotin synthetase